jgi:hypothetical protein
MSNFPHISIREFDESNEALFSGLAGEGDVTSSQFL